MSSEEQLIQPPDSGPLVLNEENLGRNVFRLALPAVLESLSFSVVMFVDLVMIGWLESIPAMSAVGAAGALAFFVTILFLPIGVGVTALVARSVGARNMEEARNVTGQGILLAMITGAISSIVLVVFAPQILQLMNVAGGTRELAIPYQRLLFGAFFFRLVFMVGASAIKGAGNTHTPMIISGVMNAANVALNWFLIFGVGPFPRLEVLGAGIGSAAAFALGAVLMTCVLFTRHSVIRLRLRHVGRRSWRIIRMILAVSLPNIGEQMFFQFGLLLCFRIVTQLGDAAIAAHTISIRIASFSFLPGMGFAVAAATLAGQSLGAGDARLAAKSIRRTAFLASILMSLVAVLLAVFPEFLAGIFKPAPPVRSLIVPCLIVGALAQIPLGISMSYSGGLRGAGDTVGAMMIAFIGIILVRVPLALLLALILRWGLVGVWAASGVDWTTRAVFGYILVKRGAWRSRMAGIPGPEPVPLGETRTA